MKPAIMFMLLTATGHLAAQEDAMDNITVENDCARLVIGANARGVQLIDTRGDTDYAVHDPDVPFARISIAGKDHMATNAAMDDNRLTLTFGDSGATAVVGVQVRPRYFVLRVLEFAGADAQSLTFCDIRLSKSGLDQPFGACVLALNLKTDVREYPGANSRLRADAHDWSGYKGALAALVACPTNEMRDVLKNVVTRAPDLPHSPIGGPWALDGPDNRSSYLFNFGGLTVDTADAWIAKAKSIGFNQIQIHGGGAFRFGDCHLDAAAYPNGRADLRAAIDKLHEAGLIVGMQPYAFFMDKRCPWVTPVPDPGLAKDATFTLAQALPADATGVPVVEPTTEMSTITGFFERNSVTLQIDDELITYTSIDKEAPYAFTGCQRGAWGTQVANHAEGAKVHHLKECFGLFAPDPETPLFEEVAARTAEFYNDCGFDGIYFDALDGEDVLGGGDKSWHYGSKYVFEVWKRLDRPAIMEMSTFHHHLWYVRSRMGAWDHPTRSHKRFIDMHVASNGSNERMFLPGNLGWWAFKTWGGAHTEPTFADDIEYLCAKAMGTDSGLSCTTYDENSPGQQRLAEIVRQYETLRHAGYFPEHVKERLAEPGAEFTLESAGGDEWQLRPATYSKHKITGQDDGSGSWTVANDHGAQAPRLRIEGLIAGGSFDDPEAITLTDFADTSLFTQHRVAPGVTMALETLGEAPPGGGVGARITATSTLEDRRGSFGQVGRVFDPPLNLSGHEVLGLWVKGDGQGELLNVQLQSPGHISHGIADFYTVIDFEGWRYVELVEAEGERHAEHGWPYSGAYAIYRELVRMNTMQTLAIWVNDLPAGGSVSIDIGPIKGVAPRTPAVTNPRITVAGRTMLFPTSIPTGSYVEYDPEAGCALYGQKGETVATVEVEGDPIELAPGKNQLSFACDGDERPRARVTVMTKGEPLE